MAIIVGTFSGDNKNMQMQYNNGAATEGLSKCIGGGAGVNGIIIIEDCIFENKAEITDSYAVATDYDEVVLVNPFTGEITPSAEWQFNADEDIFGKLEENNLAYVSMKTHHGIWSYIEDVTPDEIQNKNQTPTVSDEDLHEILARIREIKHKIA